MIIYRPSVGNLATQVNIDSNGNWFGESLGSNVIKQLTLPVFPGTKVDSRLLSSSQVPPGSQSSNWFYKDVTDFDFIGGTTTYRCLYIGCEADGNIPNFSEFIETIGSNVSYTTPTTYPNNLTQEQAIVYLANSVSLSLWYEGTYNIYSSKNTFVANDELDSTSSLEKLVLESGRTWEPSLSLNAYIQPGQYIKIWIKRTCIQDNNLLNFQGFSYTYTINDLVISNITRTTGRLNISSVYSGDLTVDNNINLQELIPLELQYNSLLKIVDKNTFSNIFYLDQYNQIHDLIVQNLSDVSLNKFMDYNFNAVTGAISGNANYAFARLVQCLDGNIQYFNQVVDELVPYLNKKFIIDILPSNKDEVSYCYIFYNEMLPVTNNPNYQTRYNHLSYSWNFGIIKVNLSFSNDMEFSSIQPGFVNRKIISILDASEVFLLKKDYFATSVILQDDLFTIVGYEIEDCQIQSKKSFINYLWEKDIINNVPKLTRTFVPQTSSTQITTVVNDGISEAYLIFDDVTKINTVDFDNPRRIKSLNDGQNYLQVSSPSEKGIQIGSTSVSYDATKVIDNFSYSVAFDINAQSIQTNVPINIIGNTTFDDNYPPHKHLLLEANYDNYTQFKPVYQDQQRASYTVQQIRQDAIQIENINPFSEVVPLTGNEFTSETVYPNLEEILAPSGFQSINFGGIVKLSGDGNTALIIIPNYPYVNNLGYPYLSTKTSKVLVYKRCGIQWMFISEIVPSAYGIFSIGVFLQILDEDKIDINYDGSVVVISSIAKSGELGVSQIFGQQFTYNGYIVRVYSTTNEWSTYTQQVIESDIIVPKEQQSFLSFYEFGYSVSLSKDGTKLLIGSPNEYFNYEKFDAKGVLLDQYNLENNGAIYLVTTNSITGSNVVDISASIGLTSSSPLWNPFLDLNQDGVINNEDVAIVEESLPNRDYIYGDSISGSNWNFVARFVPYDSNNMTVGGISYKECLANGFQGRRFGEKVRLNYDASIFGVSAKNDSQIYLNGGAIYAYLLPSYANNCLLTQPPKIQKITPSNIFKNMYFSSSSFELSKDGLTFIVGCSNEQSFTGSVHIFTNINWYPLNQSENQYNETIISDPEATIGGNFGISVKCNVDASTIIVKSNFTVKQFTGNPYSYFRRYYEFDKIPTPTMDSGDSLDMSDDGFTLTFGAIGNVSTMETGRVFIFDEFPITKSLIYSINCPTTGSSGTSGTSGSPLPPIIVSDLYSIPIYYLTEVNYIPKYYTVQVLVDELLPQTTIGLEVQPYQYIDAPMGIINLHCNGNPSVYALDVAYNFYQQEWILNYFNTKAQLVTVIIAQSGISLSPNYTNVITLNTTRKQVNGYYCGKRYFVNFEICVNGKSLYTDSSYTFDTTNTYVVTYNQNSSFISTLNFAEVRDYLDNAPQYNNSIFSIYSNVYWPELGQEQLNSSPPRGFEKYIYKRTVLLHNLPWENRETLVVPIVLQGNAYNVSDTYSLQLRRSIFDFSKINTSMPTLAFGYEGVSKQLAWFADAYDSDKDMMVAWVKLDEWNGQMIDIYYGELDSIVQTYKKNPFDEYFAFWRMTALTIINRLRYNSTTVFNGGEALILSQNNGNSYITQINKQYMLGNVQLYKSNQFDVYYDDSQVSRERTSSVENFITSNVTLFSPAFMNLRSIQPLNTLLVEANSAIGEDNGQ